MDLNIDGQLPDDICYGCKHQRSAHLNMVATNAMAGCTICAESGTFCDACQHGYFAGCPDCLKLDGWVSPEQAKTLSVELERLTGVEISLRDDIQKYTETVINAIKAIKKLTAVPTVNAVVAAMIDVACEKVLNYGGTEDHP